MNILKSIYGWIRGDIKKTTMIIEGIEFTYGVQEEVMNNNLNAYSDIQFKYPLHFGNECITQVSFIYYLISQRHLVICKSKLWSGQRFDDGTFGTDLAGNIHLPLYKLKLNIKLDVNGIYGMFIELNEHNKCHGNETQEESNTRAQRMSMYILQQFQLNQSNINS
jgi:hypothetical protein